MPDKKLSAFDAAVALTDADQVHVLQSGNNTRATAIQVRDYANVVIGTPSIAALKALLKTDLTNGKAYLTQSYYATVIPSQTRGGARYRFDAASTDADDGVLVIEPSGAGAGRFHLIHSGVIDVTVAGSMPWATSVADRTTSALRIQAALDLQQLLDIVIHFSDDHHIHETDLIAYGSVSSRAGVKLTRGIVAGSTAFTVQSPPSHITDISTTDLSLWTGLNRGSPAVTSTDTSIEKGFMYVIFNNEDIILIRNLSDDPIETQEVFIVQTDNGTLDQPIRYDYPNMLAAPTPSASIKKISTERFFILDIPRIVFEGAAGAGVIQSGGIDINNVARFHLIHPEVFGDGLSDDFIALPMAVTFSGNGVIDLPHSEDINIGTTNYGVVVRTCGHIVVNNPSSVDIRRSTDFDHTKRLEFNGGTFHGFGAHYSAGEAIIRGATIMTSEIGNIIHHTGGGLTFIDCIFNVDLRGVSSRNFFNMREDYCDLTGNIIIRGGSVICYVDNTTSDDPDLHLFDLGMGASTTFDFQKTLETPPKIVFAPDETIVRAAPGTTAAKKRVSYRILTMNDAVTTGMLVDRNLDTDIYISDKIRWNMDGDEMQAGKARVYMQASKAHRWIGRGLHVHAEKLPIFQAFLSCNIGNESLLGRFSLFLGRDIPIINQLSADNGIREVIRFHHPDGVTITRAVPGGSEPALQGGEKFGVIGSWVFPHREEDGSYFWHNKGEIFRSTTAPTDATDGQSSHGTVIVLPPQTPDDGVSVLIPPKKYARLHFTSVNEPSGAGIFMIDIAGGAQVFKIAGDAVVVAGSNSDVVPTGTTGVDGNITVFVNSATQRVYIENRVGEARNIRIMWDMFMPGDPDITI